METPFSNRGKLDKNKHVCYNERIGSLRIIFVLAAKATDRATKAAVVVILGIDVVRTEVQVASVGTRRGPTRPVVALRAAKEEATIRVTVVAATEKAKRRHK